MAWVIVSARAWAAGSVRVLGWSVGQTSVTDWELAADSELILVQVPVTVEPLAPRGVRAPTVVAVRAALERLRALDRESNAAD